MDISAFSGLNANRYSTKQTDLQTIQQSSAQQQEENAETVQTIDASDSQVDTGTSNANTEAALYLASNSTGTEESALASLIDSSDSDEENQTLINKANSGAQLNASELSELKELDPVLYAQVMKAQAARDELRESLGSDPSRASQAVQAAVNSYAGEDNTLVRNALNDEYLNLASKYDQVSITGLPVYSKSPFKVS